MQTELISKITNEQKDQALLYKKQANSDPNQTSSAGVTSEKTTIATLKSSTQVTSTFDNMKSSTTSFKTQANEANLNATSVELLTKSDISTIKPNDTKGTIEPTLYNGTSITTTIWDTQSTDITTSAIFLIKQNTTKNPISTTISSKGIETVYWSTDLSIENSSMVQYDETSTMSWYNEGKISFTNLSQNINCLLLKRKY